MARPLVRDWVGGFLDRHKARHKTNDWPADGSPEYGVFMKGWITVLSLKQAEEHEADHASELLMLTPPQWRDGHLKEVVRVIEEVRAANAPVAPASSDRDSAALASKDCQLCYGQGLAVVYHPSPDERRGVAPSCSAHCSCPLGRWMRANTAPDVRVRIPDVNDLRGYLLDPPGFEPMFEPGMTPAEMIRSLTRRQAVGATR